MSATPTHRHTSRFLRGQMARVRSKEEILATLDAEGRLEGLPFMPEMEQFCGREFRVQRRAEKVFLDHYNYMGRMTGTVLLEGARCDGRAHRGCKMSCHLLWKEAWLEPADVPPAAPPKVQSLPILPQLITETDGRLTCQATELVRATVRMPWWDPRQYLRDIWFGEATVGQVLRELAILVYNKLGRTCGWGMYGGVRGSTQPTKVEPLNLETGELVEVKTREEIAATLDKDSKTRGLGFTAEMARHCGRRYRVAGHVDKIILEWSGEIRTPVRTVILDAAICQGIGIRRCPRGCYLLWREDWLKRVAS